MGRMRKIFAGFLPLCLACTLWAGQVSAAEPYTYQVTFYPGNHGAFTGANHVNVDNGKSGSDYQVRAQGDAIVVSGLKPGDRVNFDAAMDGAVSLGENSKYYVKGIRLSGRDNDTVGMSSFEVKGDQEYVVAYGIRGDMTSYVVNYEDTRGNTLAPSRTYYGNVGDRPVIAFFYIEGYEPQAYNLTKTLSANAAENVFTFTYARMTAGGGGGTGGGTGGGGATGEETGGTTPAPGTETGAAAAGGAAAPAGTGAAGAAPAGGAAAAPGGAGAGVPGGADAGVAAPDGEVPQAEGPEELQELDDEDVPLAGEAGGVAGAARNMAGAVAIAGAAGIALIALLILWLKRSKKEVRAEKDS
ncbi:MAG: hypothetical protein HFI92_04435 [Lachnospiraceae bacterium]|nr:hypothetical protein [Lachnospiraceae bacterium]